MLVKREVRRYCNGEDVWAGRYKNSHNLLHWHYDCELIYIEYGALEIVCDKTTYTVNQSEAFFINSEQMHYMRPLIENTVAIVIIFNYNLVQPIVSNFDLACPHIYNNYGIIDIYNEIIKECMQKQAFYGQKAAILINQLILNIFRNEKIIPLHKTNKTTNNFKSLLLAIEENFENFNMTDAAEFMGMNASYFSRMFHRTAGISFSQYINIIKCEKAVGLLLGKNDMSITEISDRSGFDTIRNFNRTFKKFTGYTPSSLPKDYTLDKALIYPYDSQSNPTLVDCELLESSDEKLPQL